MSIESRYPAELGLLPKGKPTLQESKEFFIFAKDAFNKVKRILEKN
ncbi:MAG: hypothetical protein V1872_05600 [bacterium]